MVTPERARQVLLDQIARLGASDAVDAASLRLLAEAYALVVAPERAGALGDVSAVAAEEQPAPSAVGPRRPSPGLDDR